MGPLWQSPQCTAGFGFFLRFSTVFECQPAFTPPCSYQYRKLVATTAARIPQQLRLVPINCAWPRRRAAIRQGVARKVFDYAASRIVPVSSGHGHRSVEGIGRVIHDDPLEKPFVLHDIRLKGQVWGNWKGAKFGRINLEAEFSAKNWHLRT
jgi:hypothetical protein